MPLDVITLANTIAQIVLLAIQSEPEQVRRANALLAFQVFWAIVSPLVPDDTRKQVEAILSSPQSANQQVR